MAASRTPSPRHQLSSTAMDAVWRQAELVDQSSPAGRTLAMGLFEKMKMRPLQQILGIKSRRGLTVDKLRVVANFTVKLESLKRSQLKLLCSANELKCSNESNSTIIEQLYNHKKSLEQSSKETELSTGCNENSLKAETDALRTSWAEERMQLLKEKNDAIEKCKLADVTAMEVMRGYEEQKQRIKYLEERLALAQSQIVEGDEVRKKLHNTILELKGNIRVFCRVRPLIQYGGDSNVPEGAPISFPTSVEFAGRGIDIIYQGQKHSFSYDKVFAHDASQEEVFVEISQLVQSALDGNKVCIFAYGQTGSGKTYTMMGKERDAEKGIIPRSLEQIFMTSRSLKDQGWNYSMQVSMLEIYNETIYDLLAPPQLNSFEMSNSKHTVKHDPHWNIIVSDLTLIDVFGIGDVTGLFEKAAQRRSVGKTQMNEQSSRSHFVFTLKISASNENTGQNVQGVLNLIDLAGSVRPSKSGCIDDRLKETQSINKSLSALTDVIFAIAKGDNYIPFRNSKLTYLLQPCLGGDSKTLMFVNISPEASSVGETVCSLRFASRVNACEPRRQTQAHPHPSGSRLRKR